MTDLSPWPAHRFPIVRKSVRRTYRKTLRVLADEPMGPHKREYNRRTYGRRDPLPLMIGTIGTTDKTDKNGKTGKAVGYACGTCGTVQSAKRHGLAHAKEAAFVCCLWIDRCRTCHAEIGRNSGGTCQECRSKSSFIYERNRARKATPIEDTGDPVCCVFSSGEWGEGYSSSVEAHLEAWQEEHGEWTEDGSQNGTFVCPPPPCFVFATHACTPEVSIESVDESLSDEMHEDFDPADLPGHDELCAAIKVFNAAQKASSFNIDYSRVIVIDPVRFEEYLGETWDGTPDTRWQDRGLSTYPVWPRPSWAQIAAASANTEVPA